MAQTGNYWKARFRTFLRMIIYCLWSLLHIMSNSHDFNSWQFFFSTVIYPKMLANFFLGRSKHQKNLLIDHSCWGRNFVLITSRFNYLDLFAVTSRFISHDVSASEPKQSSTVQLLPVTQRHFWKSICSVVQIIAHLLLLTSFYLISVCVSPLISAKFMAIYAHCFPVKTLF